MQWTQAQRDKLLGLYHLAKTGEAQYAADCDLLSDRPVEQACPEDYDFYVSAKGFGCCRRKPEERKLGERKQRAVSQAEARQVVQPMTRADAMAVYRGFQLARGAIKQADQMSRAELDTLIADRIASEWSREQLEQQLADYANEQAEKQREAVERRAEGREKAKETRKRQREHKAFVESREAEEHAHKRQRAQSAMGVLDKTAKSLQLGHRVQLEGATIRGWHIGPSGETSSVDYEYKAAPAVLVKRSPDARRLEFALTEPAEFVYTPGPEGGARRTIRLPAQTHVMLDFDVDSQGTWRGEYRVVTPQERDDPVRAAIARYSPSGSVLFTYTP